MQKPPAICRVAPDKAPTDTRRKVLMMSGYLEPAAPVPGENRDDLGFGEAAFFRVRFLARLCARNLTVPVRIYRLTSTRPMEEGQ